MTLMSCAWAADWASPTSKASRRLRSTSGATRFESRAKRAGLARRVRLLAEPGRAIVAQAGVTLYRVGAVKPVSARTYVAVDGGMSDNPRPVLYGSGYEAFDVEHPMAERPVPVRLVGKHCESGDVLIDEAWLPARAVSAA